MFSIGVIVLAGSDGSLRRLSDPFDSTRPPPPSSFPVASAFLLSIPTKRTSPWRAVRWTERPSRPGLRRNVRVPRSGKNRDWLPLPLPPASPSNSAFNAHLRSRRPSGPVFLLKSFQRDIYRLAIPDLSLMQCIPSFSMDFGAGMRRTSTLGSSRISSLLQPPHRPSPPEFGTILE